ncbi:hypothetical protein PIB30_089405, partial [Stylosanthes scabra]|nr:hypothetical protein [Stylosanthes scabra]
MSRDEVLVQKTSSHFFDGLGEMDKSTSLESGGEVTNSLEALMKWLCHRWHGRIGCLKKAHKSLPPTHMHWVALPAWFTAATIGVPRLPTSLVREFANPPNIWRRLWGTSASIKPWLITYTILETMNLLQKSIIRSHHLS